MAFSWRASSVALIIAFSFTLLLSCRYHQRYIEFDVASPATPWLHLYTSFGGKATHSNYKVRKIVSAGKPVRVRLPLIPNSFDALIISLDKPGGTVAISGLKISRGNGAIVSDMPSESFEASASGTLETFPGRVLLTPTGLSETLDVRINFSNQLPVFSEGGGLYFFKSFLLSALICFPMFYGLGLLADKLCASRSRNDDLLLPHTPSGHQSVWNLQLLTAGLFLIIFGSRLSLINVLGSDLPFWDQWDAEAANLYIPYFNGTLSLSDMFSAHNEHRIFLTRLASLGLLLMNGKWDPLLQMVLNAAIYSAVGVFVFRSLLPSSYRIIWSGFVALIFSLPFGWQNTLGGFQLQFYLLAGLSLLFIWIVTSIELGWHLWAGALICATLLPFTMASGFLAGVALLLPFMLSLWKQADKVKSLLPVLTLSVALIGAGMLLKTEVTAHLILKADSPAAFSAALAACLGWPLSIFPIELSSFSWSRVALYLSAILLWIPSLAFLFIYIKSDGKSRKMNFIAGVTSWIILQSIATAYARGAQLLPASRYQDLLALGLAINFVLIIYLRQSKIIRKCGWIFRLTVLFWLMGAASGLIRITWLNSVHALPDRGSQQQASLENVREFLASGNINALKGKPRYDLPYPEYQKLAMLLENKEILRMLPAAVTGRTEQGKLEPFVNVLLKSSHFIGISGLLCFGLYISGHFRQIIKEFFSSCGSEYPEIGMNGNVSENPADNQVDNG
jgi:hypothetical protein